MSQLSQWSSLEVHHKPSIQTTLKLTFI